MKTIKLKPLIMLLFICLCLGVGCDKDEDKKEVKNLEGYIVGFDPCRINHHYRIGYVIISEDLKDTVVTYNLSDPIFKFPASVCIILSDTLYKIPESYFNNYMNSAYFPKAVRYEFKINIKYVNANENEKIFNLCSSDINHADFSYQISNNQVIIKSVSNL
ncbi:hypothetical protein [Marinifilum sp. D737]|uniref:hypothetical protein n=1 Tax=Marinifilum sp. D737 TaxID=2969628 RepID=UPI0022748B0D|nr:hypothetical protein [Marinifilum sp. D737]MCY1633071.1 hypothetical protein [Marinifilum sp. D737]